MFYWVSCTFDQIDCINRESSSINTQFSQHNFSLLRYLHPTDEELRTLAGVPKERGGKGKGDRRNGNQAEKSSTFHIPRNLDVQLDSVKISQYDVVHLRYYTEYQWLIDFSLYSIIVYLISETYHFYFPINDEVNLSMLWCALVIFFAL